MLYKAHEQGIADALARYRVKTALPEFRAAWDPKAGWGTQLLRMLTGHPDKILGTGGRDLFKGHGPLNPKSIFWPTKDQQGNQMPSKYKWLSRAGTLMGAIPVAQALAGKGDPNEGRLSNALSAVGGTIGGVYGGQALGMLGGTAGATIGSRLGGGLGRILGSSAKAPPINPESHAAEHAAITTAFPQLSGGYY